MIVKCKKRCTNVHVYYLLAKLLQNSCNSCKNFQNFYIQNMPSSQYILKSNGFMGILIRNITYMIYFILK